MRPHESVKAFLIECAASIVVSRRVNGYTSQLEVFLADNGYGLEGDWSEKDEYFNEALAAACRGSGIREFLANCYHDQPGGAFYKLMRKDTDGLIQWLKEKEGTDDEQAGD